MADKASPRFWAKVAVSTIYGPMSISSSDDLYRNLVLALSCAQNKLKQLILKYPSIVL